MSLLSAPPTRPVQGVIVGLFRVVTGLLFACHGAASLLGLFGGPMGGRTPAFGAWPSWWAAVIELVGGVLLVFGLFSRLAALICSGAMAYAYFSVHQENALWPIQNGGELAAVYSWAFLALFAVGPGAFSVDGLLAARRGAGQDASGADRAARTEGASR